MVREGRVFISPTAGNPQYGVGYYVTAYEVGAQVTAASSGTTATVAAGHGFAALDKFIVGTDVTQYRTVSAVTSTTLTLSASISLAEGDLLVNLAQDTGTIAPNYDGAGLSIYTDMDYSNVATTNTVLTDQYGRYRYFHKGNAIWELVRSASGPIALYTGVLDQFALFAGNSSDKSVVINGGGSPIPGYTIGDGAALNYGNIVIDRPSTGTWPSAITFSRDKKQRWAIGEDEVAGTRRYLAIWSDKGANSGGAWITGDIFGVSWAGADTNGLDGPKWHFNGAFSSQATFDQNYMYEFNYPSLRTSGSGVKCAWFGYAHNDCDSGGVIISMGGGISPALVLDQNKSGNRYAAIQMGKLSGSFLWEMGTDLSKTGIQSFSIYDAVAGLTRFHINASGFVGLGTITPDSPLHVYKDQNSTTFLNVSNPSVGTAGAAAVYAGDGSTGPSISITRYSTGYTVDATLAGDGVLGTTGTSSMLHFFTDATKRMTLLNSAAKLGIGIDPPVQALDVVGSGKFTTGIILATGAAPTVAASQVGFGATVAATATNGTGEAMKANVEGYLIVNVAGTVVKVPYVKT